MTKMVIVIMIAGRADFEIYYREKSNVECQYGGLPPTNS